MDEPIDRVLTALDTAESHISTEYQDDISITVATVSKLEPRYAMMPTPGKIHVVTNSEGVLDYYRNSRAVFQPMGLRIKTQIATDWYMFLEGVATRRARDTGEEYTTNTVTLFPAASDGIVGEFLWERYDGSPTDQAAMDYAASLQHLPGARAELPAKAVLALRIHDDMVQALRANDLDAFTRRFADDFLLADRSYVPAYGLMAQGEGRAAAVAYWRAFLDLYRIDDVSTVNRINADWFVFAELAIVVTPKAGGPAQRIRTATFFPMRRDGRVMGQLGYGTEAGPAPADGPRKLGIAVYGRDDYRDPFNYEAANA